MNNILGSPGNEKSKRSKNLKLHNTNYSVNSYLFKVNNRNARTMREYAPKSTMRIPEQLQYMLLWYLHCQP